MSKLICFPMGLAAALGAAGEVVQPLVPQVELSRDPAKKVQASEFRSVATETFLGIAGITLMEVAP